MRLRDSDAVRRFVRLPRTEYVLLGMVLLLGVVVLAQGVQLGRLGERADRLAAESADKERAYQRRLAQLEDRTDALADRVARSLDPAAVAKHVVPSVFRVNAGRSSGTAFAAARTPEGGTYLLTNYHVVDELPAGRTVVTLTRDGQRHQAVVMTVAPKVDLAVLRTDVAIPLLATATTPPVRGEPVVVVGAPVGLDDTVTSGVVSRIRPVPDRGHEYIQFDAAINPGNSGGPVLNARGRVVGIATAKVMDAEGIGFALPIGIACDSFDFIC
ncbi:MAG: S1C family serine protease [Micromonosporaceae bacterium]